MPSCHVFSFKSTDYTSFLKSCWLQEGLVSWLGMGLMSYFEVVEAIVCRCWVNHVKGGGGLVSKVKR